MNIRQTIKKVLKEENSIDNPVKLLLRRYYYVDYDFNVTHDEKFYTLDVNIRPKKIEDKGIFGIYSYYSIWTKKGKYEDENSAYMDGGFFKKMGLEKEFLNYIRNEVKEKIQTNLDKILTEQQETQSDLSKQIKKVTNQILMDFDPNKKYVCSYELLSPFYDGKYSYRMFIHFNTGPNSSGWPRTQAVRVREEAILNEIQDYILNFIGEYVSMYSVNSKC